MKQFGNKPLWREIKKNIPLYIMVIPGLLFFLVFAYIPMPFLIVAFQDYNLGVGILGSSFVGLEHFRELFSDRYFSMIIRNTITINLLKLFLFLPVPIFIALCFNEMKPSVFKRISQSTVYLPHFFSWIIVYGIMLSMLSVNNGLVNQILRSLGMEPMAFTTTARYYKGFLVVSDIWKESGWSSIIYIAALSGVSEELYEAAIIDGASKLKRIWHISIPGIQNTIIILFILGTGSILTNSFEQVFITINSAVYDAGEIISTYVYNKGLTQLKISYATAIGLFQSFIGFGLVVLSNKLAAKFGGYSLW